jgi:sialic acid synthase SpsE
MTTCDWNEELVAAAKSVGISWFSTPFDPRVV